MDDDMTLTEFLLARIAEDEQAARAAQQRNGSTWVAADIGNGTGVNGAAGGGPANPRAYPGDESLWDDEGALGMWPETAAHVARWDPARVLAECEAKRWIVAEMANYWVEGASRTGDLPEVVLTALALPYADHPDYRDAWRP